MLAMCCRSVSPPVEWRRRYGGGGRRLSSWLAVAVYGWVVGVVVAMMIRAFLFARFARGAASLTATVEAYDSCVCVGVCSRVCWCVFACVLVCVFVCVRAFAPYLPPLPARLPGVGVVVVKRS